MNECTRLEAHLILNVPFLEDYNKSHSYSIPD